MKQINMTIAMAIGAFATLSPAPAVASNAFDACVEKLCVSSDQMNCWVKSGAELCDSNGGCSDVPDHAGALVLERGQGQWQVQTQYGTGWVSDRYMMVDSSFCPGL